VTEPVPYQLDGLASLSLAMGTIVVVFWGAVWALRRLRPSAALWGGSGDCRILRSMTLGPRERLVVVRVGPRHLVLGVSAAAISLLCELDEPLAPVAAAPSLTLPRKRGKEGWGFGQALRKAAQRWHGD
jgi:flagellar protein FliO/FliZ